MMCLTLKYVDETYLHIVHAAVVLNKPLNLEMANLAAKCVQVED